MDKMVKWSKYNPKDDDEVTSGLGNTQTIKIKTSNQLNNLVFDEDIPFEFYTGLTKFDIDNHCRDIIRKSEGVEIVRPVSRYRVVVAIAPLFEHKVVLNSITNQLLTYVNQQKSEEAVEELTEEEATKIELMKEQMELDDIDLGGLWFVGYEKPSLDIFSVASHSGSSKFQNELRKFVQRYIYDNNGGIIKSSE